MSLTRDAFIINVAAWAESGLIGVDVLELAGQIANYRIVVERSFVALCGSPIDAGGPLTVLATAADDLHGWQLVCRTLRRTENVNA